MQKKDTQLQYNCVQIPSGVWNRHPAREKDKRECERKGGREKERMRKQCIGNRRERETVFAET